MVWWIKMDPRGLPVPPFPQLYSKLYAPYSPAPPFPPLPTFDLRPEAAR